MTSLNVYLIAPLLGLHPLHHGVGHDESAAPVSSTRGRVVGIYNRRIPSFGDGIGGKRRFGIQ